MTSALMSTVIHIEIDVLCLLILCAIGWQSAHNVSQQMSRVLFRQVVYGVMTALALDILWLLVEGAAFPGAIALNRLSNALYLSISVLLGCLWYLYVLETLGYAITRWLFAVVMLVGLLFTILNLVSMFTGWVFYVTPENVYYHGRLFWVQEIGAYGMLLLSLIHILIELARGGRRVPRRTVLKLLGFYILPVIGALVALPFTGMPGAWTCASISIVLMYIDDQDREILRDSLTGLNNRKTLDAAFADYARQATPQRPLYLFMMDLDRFKQINDTYGHPEGDKALVAAAGVLSRSVAGMRAIIARFGGDEFLVMGLLAGDEEAARYKQTVADGFDAYNRQHKLPYRLAASIGYSRYEPGQDFAAFVAAADASLYADKERRRARR